MMKKILIKSITALFITTTVVTATQAQTTPIDFNNPTEFSANWFARNARDGKPATTLTVVDDPTGVTNKAGEFDPVSDFPLNSNYSRVTTPKDATIIHTLEFRYLSTMDETDASAPGSSDAILWKNGTNGNGQFVAKMQWKKNGAFRIESPGGTTPETNYTYPANTIVDGVWNTIKVQVNPTDNKIYYTVNGDTRILDKTPGADLDQMRLMEFTGNVAPFYFDDVRIYTEPVAVLSVNDLASEINAIYPVPSSGNVTIDLKDTSNFNVTVSNVAGQQVIAEKEYNGTAKISLEGLSAGVYFANIESNGKSVTKQLVKN